MIGLALGAVLGVVCIIGASVRSGGEQTATYLFSFWFNRVVMGLVFGLLPVCLDPMKRTVRGFALGLFVSFAFFSSTEFQDWLGFFAGGVYGIILAWVTDTYGKSAV
jgi:hypothetical protein